jgi:TPR repeat protein
MIDLKKLYIVSNRHERYENGIKVSDDSKTPAKRSLKIETNISGDEGYTVTIYNLDGEHEFWQNNIQMSPKKMKVIQQTPHKIVLRGYGHDPMGFPFSGYGLTLYLDNGQINKCTLHLHDRNVDLEYLDIKTERFPESDNNDSDTVKQYRKSAEEGNATAQTILGYLYLQGEEGVPQNYHEAIKWFQKSAAQGNAIAQYNLGVCYYNGWGVITNYHEAMKWYKKSAVQGCAQAQHCLDDMLAGN